VEVVTAILKKLKADAETLHFHQPVQRVVVTVPAAFDAAEREKVSEAAQAAGFTEVALLPEPVAAALAYARDGFDAGQQLLIYDLGAGTFDLAVVTREADSFRLALDPQGLRACGGDDFDLALYDHLDEATQQQLGEPLCRDGLDLKLLRDCRRRKESLSSQERVTASWYVQGRQVKHVLERSVFEGLISDLVDRTVRLTRNLLVDANHQRYPVETVVLIGGSSRVPLVQRQLAAVLPKPPQRWHHQDVAVALGAAYHGGARWRERPKPVPVPAPVTHGAQQAYRHIVEMAWTDQRLDAAEVALLKNKQRELGLTDAAVAEIERAVMGDVKEVVLKRHSGDRDQYGSYTDINIQGVIQRFRWIEPGEFLMGSPTTEPERYDHETQHRVILTQGFWLADTACTQALWQAVMGNNPSDFTGRERPVEGVSWDDTQQFIARLNALVPGGGFRLPTEAEWEYACRAGTMTPFWFGHQIIPEQVNYDGNHPYASGRKGKYRQEMMEVKALPCNGWGLYQMHGNVCEWCQDWFGDYPSAAVHDPMGPATGEERVYRGGSWFSSTRNVRAAYRVADDPGLPYVGLGFRRARGQAVR
jgi:formylglycine-generating enzyme required for sulfatase activity